MRPVQVASVAIATMTIVSTAAAQAPASPVQQSMRQLMAAEEAYYFDHGTYTTDISALGLLSKIDRQKPPVWLGGFHAGGGGWIADAQGSNGMTGSCVAYVGNLADLPRMQQLSGNKCRLALSL